MSDIIKDESFEEEDMEQTQEVVSDPIPPDDAPAHAQYYVCKKEGPNKGRGFWAVFSEEQGAKPKYFRWVGEEKQKKLRLTLKKPKVETIPLKKALVTLMESNDTLMGRKPKDEDTFFLKTILNATDELRMRFIELEKKVDIAIGKNHKAKIVAHYDEFKKNKRQKKQ